MLIELTASRIEAAVVRGRAVVASAALRHHAPEWDHNWPAALDTLKRHLADLVKGLDAEGASALVLCATPTSAVNAHSCPTSAGASSAASAAVLALGNVFNADVHDHPYLIKRLAADAPKACGSEKPATHMLAAAETNETTQAIARLIESAGLHFEGLLPIQVVESLAACEAALAPDAEAGIRAVLWAGETRSVLAVGSPGRLRFVRTIALGTEAIVDALTRPIIRRAKPGEPITLSRDEARAMLASAGVPEPAQVIDEARAIDGASILPLIQPALQRLGLDVKQSLRFGLTEAERNSAAVRVLGPGSAVPRLQAVLERQLAPADDRPHSAEQPAPPRDSEYLSSSAGAIAAYLSVASGIAPLVPRERAEAGLLRRTRFALRTGIAATLALVAIDGSAAWLESARSAIASASAYLNAPKSVDPTALAAARASDMALTTSVNARFGLNPPLTPWLAEVAAAAGERVRLTELRFTQSASGGAATLKGVAPDGDKPSEERLRAFIDAISACPLAAQTTLKHTQRSQSDERSEQAFEITVDFVGLPPRLDHAAANTPEGLAP